MTASLHRLRARSRARRLATVPAAVLGTVLTIGLAALAAVAWRAPVLVHQCVAGDGLVGALGLRLALLRPDSTCPSGTLALGADGAQAAGVVVMVAAPVLLLHLTVAGTGAGVMALVAALVRALGRLLGRVAPAVPRPGQQPVRARAPRVTADDGPALVSWLLPTLGLRGPPALVG